MKSQITNPWELLDAEFDAWQDAKQCASLWWRDDDAALPGPKLDKLVSVSANAGLLLAVIPQSCKQSLSSAFSKAPLLRIAQHGYAHINHAPRGQGLGAWELGLHRGADVVLNELELGRSKLENYFGDVFVPVIVPPWNRIDSGLFDSIADRNYWAISTFGARDAQFLSDGLLAVNAHCDPIRWKTGAKFAGELKTISQLVDHLSAKRLGTVDANEPSGFLTHHIDLDANGWAFCERLSQAVEQHPAAQWLPPSKVFESIS